MPRYKLTIEYDGTTYYGWQFQKNGPSVQNSLSQAIKAFSGEDNITAFGAGRTDAGVHALGQIAHIDLEKDWDPFKIREAMNYHLRNDAIAILQTEKVDETFDARFSATARHYIYRIINRRPRLVIDKNRAWQVPIELDATKMHQAAQRFIGEHDFTAFRSVQCQAKSPVKTLDTMSVIRAGEEIRVETSARSFMHNQVRSMVGSLKLVGEGKWTPENISEALKSKDRSKCGPVAPACGLYFAQVIY